MRELIEIIPCHRIPERCLHINGKPMSLCTRCFAILLGYIFTPIAVFAALSIPIWVSILMAVPMLIDGFTQRWNWRKSSNSIRFLTGFTFGIGQALFISTVVWKTVELLN